MEVRAAVIGDADRIAALNTAGWRAGFRGLISDAYRTAYDGFPQLRHQTLANPGVDDIQLVAIDGRQMVGWVSGGPTTAISGRVRTRSGPATWIRPAGGPTSDAD